jgi:hypothetical protein
MSNDRLALAASAVGVEIGAGTQVLSYSMLLTNTATTSTITSNDKIQLSQSAVSLAVQQ